jgi:hypothetical protein
MAKPSKNNTERHYFEKFHQAVQLPDGAVSYGDKPDVIIHGTRKIGIEITNFFLKTGSHPDSEQRQRPLRAPIIEQARNLYRDGGGKNDTGLTICFNDGEPISLGRRRTLPKELANVAHSIDNRESGPIEWHVFRDKMPEISTIWLHSKEELDAHWRLLGSHSPDLMSEDGLKNIIREKEAKSNDYEQCDAHWLLVVADGMDPAQEQEIRIDDLHVQSDVFEKIIVYEPLFGRIVEVK